MSKAKRNCIIIGLVLVLLYFLVLGSGLTVGKGDRSEPPAWAGVLNDVISTFAPRLSLVKLYCSGARVNQSFKLNKSRDRCEISLFKGMEGDEDYWKTSLKLPFDTKAYLKVNYGKVDDADPIARPKKCRSNQPISGLELIYDPKGKTAAKECWIQIDTKKAASCKDESSDPACKEASTSFTITSKKTILTLICHDCKSENYAVENLRFE